MSPFLSAILIGAMALPLANVRFIRDIPNTEGGRAVGVEIFVDPQGVVLECKVLYPEMRQNQSARICDRIVGEDSGNGAIGQDGEAVYGYTQVWRLIAGTTLVSRNLDMQLFVSNLPPNRELVSVDLLISVNQSGRIDFCDETGVPDPEFAAIACQQAANVSFPIKTGADGLAVRYIRQLSVDFHLDGIASQSN